MFRRWQTEGTFSRCGNRHRKTTDHQQTCTYPRHHPAQTIALPARFGGSRHTVEHDRVRKIAWYIFYGVMVNVYVVRRKSIMFSFKRWIISGEARTSRMKYGGSGRLRMRAVNLYWPGMVSKCPGTR